MSAFSTPVVRLERSLHGVVLDDYDCALNRAAHFPARIERRGQGRAESSILASGRQVGQSAVSKRPQREEDKGGLRQGGRPLGRRARDWHSHSGPVCPPASCSRTTMCWGGRGRWRTTRFACTGGPPAVLEWDASDGVCRLARSGWLSPHVHFSTTVEKDVEKRGFSPPQPQEGHEKQRSPRGARLQVFGLIEVPQLSCFEKSAASLVSPGVSGQLTAGVRRLQR